MGSAATRAPSRILLTLGCRVRVVNGPLAGLEGILRHRKGNHHLILSVDLIQHSISAETGVCNLMLVRR
jgi:hypothetical protein